MDPERPSGKSAATGRPHYFGRLYEADAPCVWCGEPREHLRHPCFDVGHPGNCVICGGPHGNNYHSVVSANGRVDYCAPCWESRLSKAAP